METKHIPYLISSVKETIYRYLSDELDRHGLKGIVPSHGAILYQLYSHKKLSMKELAQKINRDKSTITALVEKLIGFGYVQKIQNPEDKRGFFVCLTEKGKKIEPIYRNISEKLKQKVFEGLNELEREILVKLLLKLNDQF